MIVQREASDGFLAGLALLAAGIALGALARSLDRPERAAASIERVSTGPDNDLETLRITTAPEGAAGSSVAGQSQAAVVEFRGERYDAELRDAEDDLWVRLSGRAPAGMRAFSLHVPGPDAGLVNWALLEAARRADIVAPRSTFVNLETDGRHEGIRYLLEELGDPAEARPRGGVFVRRDRDERWELLFSEGVAERRLPECARGFSALRSVASVARVLDDAADEMLASSKLAGDDPQQGPAAPQRVRARTIGKVFDVERIAELHALLSLFQVEDETKDACFFHDPRDERLQPVCIPPASAAASSREPVPFRPSGPSIFAANTRYNDALFGALGRVVHSAWLDELCADLEPDLSRFAGALAPGDPGVGALQQRLRAQTLFLRRTLLPADPLNFAATYRVDDPRAQYVTGEIEVVAWSTTRVPVLLEGFRFSNDAFAPAAQAIRDATNARVSDRGVVLPLDGRHVAFRFPLNERLASLEAANVLVKSARARTAGKGALTLDVHAVFRPLPAGESSEELLHFVKREADAIGD